MISAAANRPIIAPVETYIGAGAVGGYMAIPSVIGQEAAELALEKSSTARTLPRSPSSVGNSLRPVFDMRLLERWGVDPSALPPDSEVRYGRLSLWEQYPRQTALAIIVLLLQSAMIAALIYEHRLRRKAEVEVRARMRDMEHMNRFATAGELSAQIAHEGQSAARRDPQQCRVRGDPARRRNAGHFGGQGYPRGHQTDDLRASEVILRLRRFLKKAPVEPQEVNINEVVREVFEFASAQASVQRVILEQRLENMPLIIRGDPVQLPAGRPRPPFERDRRSLPEAGKISKGNRTDQASGWRPGQDSRYPILDRELIRRC